MEKLDEKFWSGRYLDDTAKWDIGYVSPPIKEYIDGLTDKSLRILIPGCGNGYEAQYLMEQGFVNVFVIDLSDEPLKNLKERCPSFPQEQLIQGDFFEHQTKYDLIFEQTFFCAINPGLRSQYVAQMKNLLGNKGRLVGLFFDAPLNEDKPPFGGNKAEYIKTFEQDFNFCIFEECRNSIPSRAGRELFFLFEKK